MYSDSSVTLSLVIAKTKIAPIIRLTIPKLKLRGALLLAKLIDSILFGLSISQVCVWNDSQIVLFWLDGNPRRLQAYIANRVSQKLKILPSTS